MENINNSIVFSLSHEGQNVSLMAEQVMASIFSEILNTLTLNNIKGTEFVVSVPSYFSTKERMQVIQAAEISGIKIDKLFNESSAVLMNYGIFRKADLHADNARIVGFADVGYSKTSFILAAVKKNGAEVLYEKCDKNLGVKNLDQNMIDFYVNEFQKKHKEDLHDNPKSIFRLRQGVEKQRTILSSNQEAALSIECLFEDTDFFFNLTRE